MNKPLIRKTKLPFKAIATIGILPSFLKKFIYRMKGYSIGKDVSIGFGAVIIGKKVTIENNAKIGLATVIRAKEITIERFASIGSFTFIDTGKLRIGEDARINEQVIIGGMQTPNSSLDLGKRTIIMEYSFINTTMPIKIGDDTGIGGHCLLFTHGSWLSCLDGFPVSFAPITIGKQVWLPWRIFIMPGVTIGDKVVIGANSLVANDVPSNVLIAGNPAKVIKENYPAGLDKDKIRNTLKQIYNDFTEHLKYNDLAVECDKTDTQIKINATLNGVSNLLIHFERENKNYTPVPNCVIIENYPSGKAATPKKEIMVLNLQNKTRIGTSKIGEELVLFFSRYGIRFERLD